MRKNYFSFVEFIHSEIAEREGIINIPNFEAIENLIKLVNKVLIPAREYMATPIYINSGYRSKELNKILGGVENSQHLYGKAADITTHDKERNDILFKYLCWNIEFDQLIRYETFIHVSYNGVANRGMVIDKVANKKFTK